MNKYFERLYNKSIIEFYQDVDNNLKNNKRMFVVTANPETLSYATKDKVIDSMLLDTNTTLVPDGIGIVKAGNILGYNIKERITGIELSEHLLEVCNQNSYSLSLLGAKEEVLEALKDKIKKNYPNIKLLMSENGYNKDKDTFFKNLAKTDCDVCLVALGIPEQEKLIYRNLKKFKKGIFVGVGGSFDVMSGLKKRAPKIFQKLNLEWLYRIVKEPKRIKRFYDNNVKFIFKIKKMKKKN